ncbi:MAG TPA: hypothetical protein VI895_14920 [Bdellovibrionota bacterium]|nr:hypothetical protein [Bdellovibrionota bacterium]
MNFSELTRMMLSSMDFFELRRTAARYAVPYQGIRRQKLVRDLERKILMKNAPKPMLHPEALSGPTMAAQSPEGAVSAKPSQIQEKSPGAPRINMFSTRNSFSRLSNPR